MKKLIMGAALLCASASGAMAADLSVPVSADPAPAPYAATHDWTGFYAGVVSGFGGARSLTHNFGDAILDMDGVLLGGTIGANWQIDDFVLGAEGDLSWSSLNGYANPTTLNENYFGTIRARAGYAVDDLLVYATGGFATTNLHADTGTAMTDTSFYGWTIGAGLEYAITDALSVKGEYLYSKYADKDVDLGGTNFNIGLSASTIRAGLNYKF